MAELNIDQIIAEMERRFPEASRDAEIDGKQAKQILAALRQHFPRVFEAEIHEEEHAILAWRFFQETLPQKFPNGKVDWDKFIRYLPEVRRNADLALQEPVEDKLRQIESDFPGLASDENAFTEQAPRVLEMLIKYFPEFFPFSPGVDDDQRREILEYLQKLMPNAFPSGKVVWAYFIQSLLTVQFGLDSPEGKRILAKANLKPESLSEEGDAVGRWKERFGSFWKELHGSLLR